MAFMLLKTEDPSGDLSMVNISVFWVRCSTGTQMGPGGSAKNHAIRIESCCSFCMLVCRNEEKFVNFISHYVVCENRRACFQF